jgi:hypothetical protein
MLDWVGERFLLLNLAFGNIKYFSHLLLDEMFWVILNAFYIIQICIAANSSFIRGG